MGATQSIHRHRDPDCSLHTILPNVCTHLDSILAVADGSEVNVALDAAFPDHLDAAMFTAINTRYPKLVAYCTSDKMLLNKVAGEACGPGIWTWCNKGKRWIVNNTKLSFAADLFACVAPKCAEGFKRLTGWQFIEEAL